VVGNKRQEQIFLMTKLCLLLSKITMGVLCKITMLYLCYNYRNIYKIIKYKRKRKENGSGKRRIRATSCIFIVLNNIT
jgi:hypothetical protein